MTVIEHTSPVGTYGAPKRAAALLAAAARGSRRAAAPSLSSPRALGLRALAGALAGFSAGSALLAAAGLACLLLLPLYLVAELLFALHFRRRLARINALPQPGAAHEPGDEASLLAEGAAAFERFLAAAARMAAEKDEGGVEGDEGARRVEALIARWCGGHSDGGSNSGNSSSGSGSSNSGNSSSGSGSSNSGSDNNGSSNNGGGSKDGGAPPTADPTRLVTRGNAAEMLTYGFYYRSQAQMAAAGFPAIGREMVARLERAIRREFAPGPANPAIALMAHLREPVRAHWRPLAFYAGTEVVALAKHWAMLCSGWRYGAGPSGAAVYTFGAFGGDDDNNVGKNGGGDSNGIIKQTPILFCHGVGLGLAPYVPMVTRLAATGRPVVAVEFKHLAMRWTSRVPTVEEAAAELAAVLASLNVARCDAVGHSFGTLFLSRLSQQAPRLVRTLALLDPVCCTMWSGGLVGTFVYNPYRAAARNGWVTHTIARDVHTAAAVSRRFFWSRYNLWGDGANVNGDGTDVDHSPRTLLAVGGRDNLVSASHVAGTVVAAAAAAAAARSGSAAGRVTMLHHPHREHADVVFHPSWQRRVLDEALAQIAAADCDDLVEELREAVAAEVAVAATVAAAAAAPAAAAPVFARRSSSCTIKATWAFAPARGFSMPPVSAAAACADGDDEDAAMLLPMQRSYTISAGVVAEPRAPSAPSPWPPRRRRSSSVGGGGAQHHHARTDSASSSAFSSCDLGSLASLGVPEEPEVEEEEHLTQQQQRATSPVGSSPAASAPASDAEDGAGARAFACHQCQQRLKAAASPFGPSDATPFRDARVASACECSS